MLDAPLPDSRPLPVRATLDRAAVERVLARAAELQATTPDAPGLLSEQQIVELGHDVGLAPELLLQALAEERSRVVLPVEEGWKARIFGPRAASASRTVRATPTRVFALLDGWLQKDECLQVKRRFPDRLTWEPRRDLLGSLRRALNLGGRGYALSRAFEVGATAVPVDEARTLVRLEADLTPARAARLRVGGATAATGIATGGTLGVLAAMVVVPTALAAAAVATAVALPALAGIGGAYVIARQHSDVVGRAQVALEQFLDRLEDESGRPPLAPLLGSRPR